MIYGLETYNLVPKTEILTFKTWNLKFNLSQEKNVNFKRHEKKCIKVFLRSQIK